jgi:phosphate starvation-inducible PhoH-like protein
VIVRKFPIEHLDPINLLGQNDANVRHIERVLPVRITLREGTITVAGDDAAVTVAARALEQLVDLAERGKVIEEADVATALGASRKNGNGARLAEAYEGAPGYAFDRRAVRPRSPTQAEYMKALEDFDVVFGIGPAGTGKTYLAVASAVNALRRKNVDRIVLVRPAVEAGESLGFLPGDMQEKVDPYLRPMYDALSDMMSYDKMRRYIELGVIEIAPLAFMRGRTLHNSFVILDEAQNTTVRQMKMFLTRLGVNSRAVVTGDVTQIDLKSPEASGLVRIQTILGGVPGLKFIYFHPEDVVRHRLVREILYAFEQYHARVNGKEEDGVGEALEPGVAGKDGEPALDAPQAGSAPRFEAGARPEPGAPAGDRSASGPATPPLPAEDAPGPGRSGPSL